MATAIPTAGKTAPSSLSVFVSGSSNQCVDASHLLVSDCSYVSLSELESVLRIARGSGHNIAFRLTPIGSVDLIFGGSATMRKKLSIRQRASFIERVEGVFSLQVFVGANVQAFGDGCAINGCIRFCQTARGLASCFAKYSSLFTSEDVTDAITFYIMSLDTLSPVVNIKPITVHSLSWLDVSGAVSRVASPQGLGDVAACAVTWLGLSAITRYLRTSVGNSVASSVASTLAFSKPSDLLDVFAPEAVELLAKYRINAVDAAIYVLDALNYLHGVGSKASMTFRAGQTFGSAFMGLSVLVDLVKDFIDDWVARPATRAQGATDFLKSFTGLFSLRSCEASIKMFHTFVIGAKDLACLVSAISTWLPVCIRRSIAHMLPETAWQVLVSDLQPDVVFRTAAVMLTPANVQILVIDGKNWEAFLDLESQVLAIQERICSSFVPPAFLNALMDVLKKVAAVKEGREAILKSKVSRRCPFVVCFYGLPKTGKSSTMKQIAPCFGTVYNRGNGEFWDGYLPGTDVVCYDDFGPTNGKEVFLELLDIVSNNAYPLNMASLNDVTIGKKNTHFTSETIFMTTNTAWPDPCDINDRGAVLRRRHLLFEFGGLDVDVDLPLIDRKRYRLLDPTSWTTTPGEWMSLKQMYETIVEARRRHFETEDRVAASLKAGFEEIIASVRPQVFAVPNFATGLPELPQHIVPLSRSIVPITNVDVTALAQAVAFCDTDILVFLKKEACSLTAWLQDKPWVRYGLCFAASLPVAYFAWTRWRGRDAVPQGVTPYERVPGRAIVVKRGTVPTNGVRPNGSGEVNKIMQCQGTISASAGGHTMRMYCVHSQRMLLVPHHLFGFLGKFDSYDIVYTRYSGSQVAGRYNFSVSDADVVRIESDGACLDICAVMLPPQVGAAPDLSAFFIDSVRVRSCEAELVSRTAHGDFILRQTVATRSVTPVRYASGTALVENDVYWHYPLVTEDGDCGALLIGRIANETKILGIHTSIDDNNHVGISFSFDRCQFDALAAQQRIQGSEPIRPQGDPSPLPKEFDGGEFYHLSTNEFKNYIPSKTSLRESIFMGCMGPASHFPSVLKKGDPRVDVDVRDSSPLFRAAAKYAHPARGFKNIPLQRAIGWAIEKFCIWSIIAPEVYDVDVAINGDPQRHVKSMDWTTSAGHGWKHLGPKRDLFTLENDRMVPKPPLAEALKRRFDMARLGKRVVGSIWLDTPKDEKRVLEKIQRGKTRVFTIGPVDFTIVCRQVCLAFAQHMIQCALLVPSAVGIDCESIQFHLMATKLARFPNYFDGDISNNDGEFPPELFVAAMTVINRWYNDDFTRLREVLLDEMLYTTQLAGNILYMTAGGNPSGNPLTTTLNTLGNCIHVAYAWFDVSPLDDVIDDHLLPFFFGDDLVYSQSDHSLQYFNPQALQENFESVGRHLTGTTKEAGELSIKTDLGACDFLKRRFTLGAVWPNVWSGLLPMNVILDTSYYVRKSDDYLDACVVNANAALREVFPHGRAQFETLRNRFVAILAMRYPQAPVLITFESLHGEFFEKMFSVKARPQAKVVYSNPTYVPVRDPVQTLNQGFECATKVFAALLWVCLVCAALVMVGFVYYEVTDFRESIDTASSIVRETVVNVTKAFHVEQPTKVVTDLLEKLVSNVTTPSIRACARTKAYLALFHTHQLCAVRRDVFCVTFRAMYPQLFDCETLECVQSKFTC